MKSKYIHKQVFKISPNFFHTYIFENILKQTERVTCTPVTSKSHFFYTENRYKYKTHMDGETS